MSYEAVATSLPLGIYMEFIEALRSGFWKDGRPVTDQQRQSCAEALKARLEAGAIGEASFKGVSASHQRHRAHWIIEAADESKLH